MKTRFVTTFAAVLFTVGAAGAALTGVAQTTPAPAVAATPTPAATRSPGPLPTIPSNTGQLVKDAIDALAGIVKAPLGWDDNRAVGTVTYYRGYDLQIKLQLGKYRDIHLHRGTVINPRGATMHDGELVDVRGRGQADGSLNADYITVTQ